MFILFEEITRGLDDHNEGSLLVSKSDQERSLSVSYFILLQFAFCFSKYANSTPWLL